MNCEKCKSEKIVDISAKCSDMFWMRWYEGKNGKRKEQTGYVPSVLGIGDDGGDYVEFSFCLCCGQIQDYQSKFKGKQ